MAKFKTKYLKFRGKAAWTMIYKTDEFRGKEFWKINFYPSDDTIAEMRKAGIQTKVKEDDGSTSGVSGKFMTLRRDKEKKFDSGNRVFCPPMVKDKKGDYLVKYIETEENDWERKGDPVLIGNGSEVEVTLEVYYTSSFGWGTRLQEIRIIDLIEYKRDEEEDVKEDDIPFEQSEPARSQELRPEDKDEKKKGPSW